MRRTFVILATVAAMAVLFSGSVLASGWYEVQAVGNSQFSIVTVVQDDTMTTAVLRVVNPPSSDTPEWEVDLGNLYVQKLAVFDYIVIMTFYEYNGDGVIFFNVFNQNSFKKIKLHGDVSVWQYFWGRGIILTVESGIGLDKKKFVEWVLPDGRLLNLGQIDLRSEVYFGCESLSGGQWNPLIAVKSKITGETSINRVTLKKGIEKLATRKVPVKAEIDRVSICGGYLTMSWKVPHMIMEKIGQ